MAEAVSNGAIGLVAAAGWVRRIAMLVIASTGVALAGWVAPGTAMAAPADDPCPMAMSLLCRVLPIAPDLDGDVDLTKQVPPADRPAAAPDSRPPAQFCANNCS